MLSIIGCQYKCQSAALNGLCKKAASPRKPALAKNLIKKSPLPCSLLPKEVEFNYPGISTVDTPA